VGVLTLAVGAYLVISWAWNWECRDPLRYAQVGGAFPDAGPVLMDIFEVMVSGEDREGIVSRGFTRDCDSDLIVVITADGDRVTVITHAAQEKLSESFIRFEVQPNGVTDHRLSLEFHHRRFGKGVTEANNANYHPEGMLLYDDAMFHGYIAPWNPPKGMQYQNHWQEISDKIVADVHAALNL
jgi:hypothetical protein